jgi:hypothetical protein
MNWHSEILKLIEIVATETGHTPSSIQFGENARRQYLLDTGLTSLPDVVCGLKVEPPTHPMLNLDSIFIGDLEDC